MSFSNDSLHYHAADFDRELFDSTGSTPTGSVYDYYLWVSGGRLRVTGEVVATVSLPSTREFYGGNAYGLAYNSTPNNAYGALIDALNQCQATVDWSRYDRDRDGTVDMVWLVHAGQGAETSGDRNSFWSVTSHSSPWSLGRPFQTTSPIAGSNGRFVFIDRFSLLPELSGIHGGSMAEIGVFCHEFGHALGLPDLYDTSALGGAANSGPGNWSLMSTGGFGSDGRSPESPSHLGAWPLQFLGWDQTIRPSRDTTITLEPLSNTGKIVELWFQGEKDPEHFLIENRQRFAKFDRTLPNEGLIVYHVNEQLISARLLGNSVNRGEHPGVVLVEADGNDDLFLGRNRGDASDPFPGSLNRFRIDDTTRPDLQSFSHSLTQLALHDFVAQGDDMVFSAQVRAPGWLPIQDFTGADYSPLPTYSPASTNARTDDGTGYIVRNEIRSGHPQIILRWGVGDWTNSFQVSNSSGAALDPTLALLPGGDLAIVWSDTRRGGSKLFYRARILGVWTAEQLLVDLPGASTAPALGADARGMLYVAFQHTQASVTELMFMRFTWRSPYGKPRAIVGPEGDPTPPAIVVAPDGETHVLWINRPLASSSRSSIWLSRFDADNGLSPAVALTGSPQYSQTAFSAVVAPDGTIFVVWETSGPGTYALRYQRRTRYSSPSPRDSLLEQAEAPFEGPSLALDPTGSLHLVFAGSGGGLAEISYRRWSPVFGWDHRSTDVSDGIDGTVTQPVVIPDSYRAVTVLFTGFPGGQAGLFARRRILPEPTLAVPAAVLTPPAVALSAGPNPLRRGETLRFAATGAITDPRVDVFDLAGRRLTTVGLTANGREWRAEFSPRDREQWQAGVYFARLRSEPGAGLRWVMLR